MTALLEARSLEVAYGRLLALTEVNLVVPAGSVVGILGPNGVGKSTLLNTIAGLVHPRAGQVVYDAQFPKGENSYRVYREPWTGQPSTPPALVVKQRSGAPACPPGAVCSSTAVLSPSEAP